MNSSSGHCSREIACIHVVVCNALFPPADFRSDRDPARPDACDL